MSATSIFRTAGRFAVLFALLGIAQLLSRGQVTNFLVAAEADAFVRELAPADNYGRAGNLSVAGASALNGFGAPGGGADSLMRFRLEAQAAELDSFFRNHDWFIARAALHLYELGMPNNPIFSMGVGSFSIAWLADGDAWEEGSGSPNAPAAEGVAFQDLAALLDPLKDILLGSFQNTGADGWLVASLGLPEAFVQDLRSGSALTLHLAPTGDEIGFTFLSRSDRRTELQARLELAAAAGPRPSIQSIELSAPNQVTIRFNTRLGWTYAMQYREDFDGAWVNLASTIVAASDGTAATIDATTSPHRIYRLVVAPP